MVCGRCSGRVLFEDDEAFCFNCGWRSAAPSRLDVLERHDSKERVIRATTAGYAKVIPGAIRIPLTGAIRLGATDLRLAHRVRP